MPLVIDVSKGFVTGIGTTCMRSPVSSQITACLFPTSVREEDDKVPQVSQKIVNNVELDS